MKMNLLEKKGGGKLRTLGRELNIGNIGAKYRK